MRLGDTARAAEAVVLSPLSTDDEVMEAVADVDDHDDWATSLQIRHVATEHFPMRPVPPMPRYEPAQQQRRSHSSLTPRRR